MCDYVSWIEQDGKLYYLTDDDVYSGYGRRQLRGVRDNDVLGHEAIRAYYGLQGGVDHERLDWWKRDLPDEIKQHIRQGACTRMLEAGLQVDDLDQIARQAPVWALKLVAKSGRLRTRLEAGVRHTKVMSWHENGQQQWLHEYADGKPVRDQRWYESGQQWYLAEYADGELVRSQDWYESGQQWYLSEYRDGKLVREQGWYESGQQRYLYEYQDGKPVRRQGWNEDGTPRQET